MLTKPYGMICPITHACNVLEPRWTIPILVALWSGATQFNEIRREIGSISPALLSRRLRELEALNLIERIEDRATGKVSYTRTEAAIALEPALTALSEWAQRQIDAELALCSVDGSVVMWNLRKNFIAEHLPGRRVVVQFHMPEDELDYDTYWAILQPGAPVEICSSIPGFDIDVYVETSLRSLCAVMIGRSTITREVAQDRMFLSGDALLVRTIDRWLTAVGSTSDIDGIIQLDRDAGPASDTRIRMRA